jgi:hypothetical protein
LLRLLSSGGKVVEHLRFATDGDYLTRLRFGLGLSGGSLLFSQTCSYCIGVLLACDLSGVYLRSFLNRGNLRLNGRGNGSRCFTSSRFRFE